MTSLLKLRQPGNLGLAQECKDSFKKVAFELDKCDIYSHQENDYNVIVYVTFRKNKLESYNDQETNDELFYFIRVVYDVYDIDFDSFIKDDYNKCGITLLNSHIV